MFTGLVVLLLELKALIAAKALVIVAVLASGAVVAGVVVLARPEFPDDPLTVVANPKVGQAVTGTVDVTGFSIDRDAKTGTGVSKVVLYLDDVDEDHKLGEATLGLENAAALMYRKDEKDDRFDKAGWKFSWTVRELVNGTHTLYVVAFTSDDASRRSVTAVELNDPLIAFEHPKARAEVSGRVALSGWALDRFTSGGAPVSAQVSRVEFYLGGTKLGEATLGLDSPQDVRRRYGLTNAGWSFEWDATLLSPGEYTLAAVAHSAVQDSRTEASLLVVVFDPASKSGHGCGWLVGTARGNAVAALQAGWEKFHTSTQAYRSKMETVDKTKREQFSLEVDGTKNRLIARRDAALAAIHAKADEYLRLCEAGRLPDQPTVTYQQNVIATSHLIYEYRTIVDAAIVDLQRIYGQATPTLDRYTATAP